MRNLYRFFLLFISILFCDLSIAQVGINTTTPLSTLDINGNLNVKEIGIANALVSGSGVFLGGPAGSATSITDGVYISLTPTSGNQEFILPDAANVPGRIYVLRNITPHTSYSAQDAKIYTFGGNFYAKDSNSITSLPLVMPSSGSLKTVIIISDGKNWTYIF